MSAVFLTGGTGSIGGAVLAQAIAAGHGVTALARSDASAAALATAGAAPLMGDIAAPENWMKTAARADVFVHLASTFDAQMAVTEPRLLNALFDAVADRRKPLRLLYTGGCWLYGRTGNAVADETSPTTPINAFAWADTAIKSLQNRPGLSSAVIHPAMVYHQAGGVFARMLRALKAGRPAPIWGSEYTRWPLIHRDDAAAGYLRIIETPDATGTFNLVTETGVPVGEIAQALAAQAGIKTRPAVLPEKWVRARHGAWGEGPMLDQQMRSNRMKALGWTAQHQDFSALRYQI